MRVNHGPLRYEDPDVRPGVQVALGCVTGAVVACVVAVVIGQCPNAVIGFWITVPLGAIVLSSLCVGIEARLGWPHYTDGASFGWHAIGPAVILIYLVLQALI